MLQQNVLLKFGYVSFRMATTAPPLSLSALTRVGHTQLMQFLKEHAADQATEIRTLYVETMGRTLHGLFRAYHNNLSKVREHRCKSTQRLQSVAEAFLSCTRKLQRRVL